MSNLDLTNNFYFLNKTPNFDYKERIIELLLVLETLAKSEDKIDNTELVKFRLIYEYILKLLNSHYKLVDPAEKSSEIYKRYIQTYGNSLSSLETMAMQFVYIYSSRFGAHVDNHNESNFVNLVDFLKLLKDTHTLLKFLIIKVLKFEGISIDDFDSDIYNSKLQDNKFIFKKSQLKKIAKDLDHDISDMTTNLIQISSLLSNEYNKNRTYYVPIYQRGYKWDSTNIETFLNDIEKLENEPNTHYFGVMAIKKNDIDGKERIKIIDGQQRITTSMLFLCAARDVWLSKTKNTDINNSGILKQYFANEKHLKNLFFNPSNNAKENDAFQKIILNNFSSTMDSHFTSTSYYKNYELIHTKLSNFEIEKLNLWISSFISYFKICLISFDQNRFTNKKEMQIFENINSKGKSLEAFDLIKNYIFNLCDDQTLANYEKEMVFTFNQVFLDKNNKLGEERISKFFESIIHYFKGKELGGKNYNRELLVKFDNVIKENNFIDKTQDRDLNIKEFKEFINKLNRYFLIWKQFLQNNGNLIKECNLEILIDLLGANKKTPLYPFMYLIIDSYNINLANGLNFDLFHLTDKDKEEIFNLVLEAIKVLVKIQIVKGQGHSEIGRKFFDYIHNYGYKVLNSSDRKEMFKKILSLLNKLVHKDEFQAKLNKLDKINDWSIKAIVQITSWHLNQKLINPLIIENIDRTILQVLPESSLKWKNEILTWNDKKVIDENNFESKTKEYANKLGNLLLVKKEMGGKKNNNWSWKDKITKLNKHLINDSLFNNSNNLKINIYNTQYFDFEKIDNRTSYLIDIIINEIFD